MVGRRSLLKRAGAAVAAVAVTDMSDFDTRNSTEATSIKRTPQARAMILLDKSGSMSIVRQATIDGLNTYIDTLRDVDLRLSLLQFDSMPTVEGRSGFRIVRTFVDVATRDAYHLTLKDYEPTGGTPLRQAVALAIRELEEQSGADDKKLLVIQTDGMDTDGGEVTMEVLKDLIEAKKKTDMWTFVFLGADIDAWGAGANIGVSAGNMYQYANNVTGTAGVYAAAARSTATWTASADTNTINFFAQGADSNDINP